MKPGDIAIIVNGEGTKSLWEGEAALIVRRVCRGDGPEATIGVWYEVLIDGKLKKMRNDYLEKVKND